MATKRNGEIDVLRFIFSIMVVIHHYCYIYGHKILGRTSRGYIAVEFFFLVTGFLMAKHVSSKEQSLPKDGKTIANETWSFLYKKVRVFFIYYLCSYAVQLIAKLAVFDWSIPKAAMEALKLIPNMTLSFVGVVANSNLYVSGNWYLSAMMIALFILYPILLKNYHMATKIYFPLISIFLMGHMYQNFSQIIVSYTEYTFMSTGLIRALLEIAVGASLYELTKTIEKARPNQLLMTLVKLFAYAVVFLYAYGYTKRDFDIHAFLWCAVAVSLSFSDVTFHIGENNLTRYLGRISLPIYIFHTIFMRCSVEILGDSIGTKMLLLLIVASTAASVVLMHVIDFLCQQIKRNKAAAAE